jgi:hypothetical protein
VAKQKCPKCGKRVDVLGVGSDTKLDTHQVKVEGPAGDTFTNCRGSGTKVK